MIAPELLARFPPGTQPEDAAAFLRATGGNLSEAVEMCSAGHQLPTAQTAHQQPTRSTVRATQPPAQQQQRTPGTNNYFVGGGDSSGQAVVAPRAPARGRGPAAAASHGDRDGITNEDSIESVFAKARENGARQSTASGANNFGDDQVFAGTGRRLGHLEGPSPVMQATRRLQKTIKITFFENGFQIDDGPLRSLTDEMGLRFIESINKGYIPRELVAEYGDVDINVNLVDRREEEYIPPPPPAYVAFGGSGRSLGATAPAAVPPPPAATASAPASVAGTQPQKPQSSQSALSVDPAEETCKVMIMNLTGVRSEHTVNPTRHTVHDLRVLSSNLQGVPSLPLHSFQLMVRDVPPRALADDTLTIDAAKCRNATIMMKRM
jgi:UBX domain-containing protein 1